MGARGFLYCLFLIVQATTTSANNGKLIGDFRTLFHQVRGSVYAINETDLVITGFSYDGTAPDAFFWIGSTANPDTTGVILSHSSSADPPLRLGVFTDARVMLKLPDGTTINDYTWLSVWCRSFTVNFGDLSIPSNFIAPAVHDLGALPTFAHGVRADSVKILDANTFLFTNLYYDGFGPDAYFWAGWTDDRVPTIDELKLIWKPNSPESGRNQRIDRSLQGETIFVTMPQGMTVMDVNHVGLWCVLAQQNFGHISFDPSILNVPPFIESEVQPPDFTHCEVLLDNEFQASWRVDSTDIKVQLSGRVDPGRYLAFGLSGSDERTLMDGSDVVVVWLDETLMTPMVVDYRLQSKQQCTVNNGNGACPDTIDSVGGTNDAMLLEMLWDNQILKISYRKPLNSGDIGDLVIPTDGPVFISWAIGGINPDGRTAKHDRVPFDNPSINFGRPGMTVCPPFVVDSNTSPPLEPWTPPTIQGETTFRLEIGPSGGERGYTGITGKVGWGIAWYVNELLIPEITVQRGTEYTFEVYGGDDSTNSARYHPFYITADPQGGFQQKTPEEKTGDVIYAGPQEGPYCEWISDNLGDLPDYYDNFSEYKDTLRLDCSGGPNPTGGVLRWTPDGSTPDLVYYQCYTHRFLGWKIRVVDDPNLTMGPMAESTIWPSQDMTQSDSTTGSDSTADDSTTMNLGAEPTADEPTADAPHSTISSVIVILTTVVLTTMLL